MKRQISILCFLIIFLMLFASCNSVEEPTVQPSETSASETGDVKPTEKPTENPTEKPTDAKPPYLTDSDNNVLSQGITLNDYSIYQKFVSEVNLPDYFVKYEDISHLGNFKRFYAYASLGVIEKFYSYYYELETKDGVLLSLRIYFPSENRSDIYPVVENHASVPEEDIDFSNMRKLLKSDYTELFEDLKYFPMKYVKSNVTYYYGTKGELWSLTITHGYLAFNIDLPSDYPDASEDLISRILNIKDNDPEEVAELIIEKITRHDYNGKYKIARQESYYRSIFKDFPLETSNVYHVPYLKELPDPSYEFKLGEENILLEYTSSRYEWDIALDRYRNDQMSVRYFNGTKIPYDMRWTYGTPDFTQYTTEEQYLSLIYTIFDGMGVTLTPDYVKSCKTLLPKNGNVSYIGEEQEGFTLIEKEKLYGYSFEFTKYYGDIPTSDKISVSFALDAQRIYVKFDPKDVDSISELNIDIDDMRNELDKYIASVKKGNVTILSFEITDEYISAFEGNPCYTFEADIRYIEEGEEKTAEGIKFAVFLNEDNYKTT